MELTDTLVIIAGDCGIGFDTPGYYRRTYQRIAKTLKKLNSSLLLVRGNHDDPEFFQRERIVFPRMRTLPDYSVIRFKDHTILCIGGATHRHGCYSYRPLFCYPTTKRGIEMWMAYDPNLEKDIDEERATMDRLHNRLLSDGHPLTHHCTSSDRIDGVSFYLLDIGQIREVPISR